MMLCDTGFMVAIIGTRDNNHRRAVDALSTIRFPVITTWPCLTEAMHLVGSAGQVKLIQQIRAGAYTLQTMTLEDALRACDLMLQYVDAPMDFADASLVVAAEKAGVDRILTFDRHFHAYQIKGNIPFEVLPV